MSDVNWSHGAFAITINFPFACSVAIQAKDLWSETLVGGVVS